MINIYDISLYDESIIEFYSQCANCFKITEHDEFKYGPNNPELFINDEYIFSSDGLDYIFYPPIKSKKEHEEVDFIDIESSDEENENEKEKEEKKPKTKELLPKTDELLKKIIKKSIIVIKPDDD